MPARLAYTLPGEFMLKILPVVYQHDESRARTYLSQDINLTVWSYFNHPSKILAGADEKQLFEARSKIISQ